MQYLAFLLIMIGTIGSAAGIARTDPTTDDWEQRWQIHTPLAVASLAVLVTGVALQRRTLHRKAGAAISESHDWQTLCHAIDAMKQSSDRMEESLDAGSPELSNAIQRNLTELLEGPVMQFVQNRSLITHFFGTAAYGEIMGAFARAERYLNRAWSACVDGYLDESLTYIRKARPFIVEAHELLAKRSSGPTSAGM